MKGKPANLTDKGFLNDAEQDNSNEESGFKDLKQSNPIQMFNN